ncbi:MAG: putative bifunctional diguanylate cyclase/phosphodiesterase [Oceanococcus sp.]
MTDAQASKVKPSVLVVDDMPANIELLVEILKNHYRVQVARHGEVALRLAAGEDPPQLILLDMMMPEMDGQEVCRRLKKNPKTRHIPVIFVTARTEVEDETLGFKNGAVDYITKPISPPTVLARVKTHITLARTKQILEQAVLQRTAQLKRTNEALQVEIGKRDEAIQRAEHLSQFDQLTSLPNRRQLQERLRNEVSRAKDSQHFLCIARINFDRMQNLNNNFGPSVADAALALASRRLQNALDTNDFIAREDGDSLIAIFNHGWKSAEEARTQGEVHTRTLLRTLERPFNLGEHKTSMSASAGLVIFPDDAHTPERLLARAQTATAVAKQQSPGSLVVYTKRFGRDVADKYSLEGRLRDALKREELEIHLQPQVELRTNRMTGAEALVRWPDGEGGFVSNARFIPVAEDAGLIVQLDHYVLKALCDQAVMWGSQLPPGFRLGFNMSAIGFQDPQCAENVIEIITNAGLPPHRFELEVTEQAVMSDFSSAIEKLIRLREFGLVVALDDFGTGYSSLAYLQQMPLDRLKVDRTFIREVERHGKSASITRAIIKLARTIGLDCLMEGVETEGQLEFCRLNGCQHVQGYFLHKPMAPADLMNELNRQQQAPS